MATIDDSPRRPRLAWHAVHTLLAAYPVALFTAAFCTDLAYVNSAEPMWSNFSVWLITGGLVMGGVVAVVGIADALVNRGTRRQSGGWLHAAGTLLALGLALINAFVHSRDGWTAVMPTGIILSGIVAVLVVLTSLLGSTVIRNRQGFSA